jgi:hypothetical protein
VERSQSWSDGKDLSQPNEHRSGINERVVRNAGLKKPSFERLAAEERLDDREVVPNVERASK